jgi:glutathione S-transferase
VGRHAELEGFAAVIEGVRNAAGTLQSRAISGPHDYEQIPALIGRSPRRVANFYQDFDARLHDVVFVAGDRFSAADIITLVTVDFATRAFAMPIPPDSASLRRCYDVVLPRPCANCATSPRPRLCLKTGNGDYRGGRDLHRPCPPRGAQP